MLPYLKGHCIGQLVSTEAQNVHHLPILTSGVSVYPHIEAMCYSTGTRYVTAEDSCCGTLRVADENHSSRIASSPSLVW